METVILTPNKIELPRSLVFTSILETLAFLPVTVVSFLLFNPPLLGLNYSKANTKEATGAGSEEPVSNESAQPIDPFSSLENIEGEEHGAKAQKRAMALTYNPIYVLRNIED